MEFDIAKYYVKNSFRFSVLHDEKLYICTSEKWLTRHVSGCWNAAVLS
jgi:hypothetical protein